MKKICLSALLAVVLLLVSGPASAFDLSGVAKSLGSTDLEGTEALETTQAGLKQELISTLSGLLLSQSSMAKILGNSASASNLLSTAKSLASKDVSEDQLGSALSAATGYNEELNESRHAFDSLSSGEKSSIAASLLSYAKSASQLGLLDDKFISAASELQHLLENTTAAQSASLLDKFSFLATTARKVSNLTSSVDSTTMGLIEWCRSAGLDVSAASSLMGI
jgi:hypothetical protein